MKKVIIILFFMFIDLHFFNSSFASSETNVVTTLAPTKDVIVVEPKRKVVVYSSKSNTKITIKSLTNKMAMTEVMNRIQNDNMIIDKISLSNYKTKIAIFETGPSKRPYLEKNRYGFIGKYQFGKSAFKTLSRSNLITYNADTTWEKNFLRDSIVQEKTMNALIVYNMSFLKTKKLHKYVGQKMNGITITAEGMLAGAHLVGPAAMFHYIKNNGSLDDFYIKGKRFSKFDGNGISIEHYLKIFSNI